MTPACAEALAFAAFSWIASDPELGGAFLAESGSLPADLRRAARDPAFLAAVLDFVLAEDARVLTFSASEDRRPEEVLRARALLPGGELPNWT